MTRKIDAIEPRIADLPMVGMGDRRFELFVHGLLKAAGTGGESYDDAVLLPHGRDQGRDIVLYKDGAVVGVVQCKCVKNALTLPQAVFEMAKMAMFVLRDPVPAGAPGNYEMWCASSLSGPARLLFDETALHIGDALSSLSAVVSRLKEKYSTLRGFPDGHTAATEFEAVRTIIEGMRLTYKVAHDINALAHAHPEVRKLHFRTPDDSISPVDDADKVLVQAIVERRNGQLREYATQGRAGNHPYAPDPALDAAFEEFATSNDTGFPILSEPGGGKSTWTARMLEAPPFALSICVISGEEIELGDGDAISSLARLALPGIASIASTRSSVERWLKTPGTVIVVDGLDRVRASAREGLADWLRQTMRRLPPLGSRIVVTSRPQAWADLVSELGAAPPGMAKEHRLRLDYAQALQLYRLHGIDSFAHGYRLLRTPSMIAMLARVRGTMDGRATRLDLLEASMPITKQDVRRLAGIGPTEVDLAFSVLQELLWASSDHNVGVMSLAARTSPRIVDAMVESGLLLNSNASVRPVLDEVLEYFLSKAMPIPAGADVEDVLAFDEVKVGALALRLANSEWTTASEIGDLLDRILSAEGERATTIAGKILVEQRDHGPHFERMRRLFRRWTEPNFLLLASPLGQLALNNSLDDREQLLLVMELACREDPLDWRRKYMTDLKQQGGRYFTQFHAAAISLVQRLGPDSLPIIKPFLEREAPVPDVVKGLATEAAVVAPMQAILVLLDWPEDVRHEVMANAILRRPPQVSQAVVDQCLAGILSREETVRLIGVIGATGSPTPEVAVAASAAKRLLPTTSLPGHRARLLMLALGDGFEAELADELVGLAPHIDRYAFWYSVAVLGDRARSLISYAMEGSAASDHRSGLLSLALGSNLPLEIGAVLLEELRRVPPEAIGAIDRAKALEGLLYIFEATEFGDAFELAQQFARSPQAEVRLPLIYYSASRPQGDDVHRDRIVSRRDALLTALIEAETGENLNVIVRKLMSREVDPKWSVDNLAQLCRRIGGEVVSKSMDEYAFLNPNADRIKAAVQERLRLALG